MKKVIWFALLVFPLFASGQKSGKIVFQQTVQLSINLPDDIPDEMRQRIPKERTLSKELLFNDSRSIFKNGEILRPDEAQIDGSGGRRMRMRFRAGGENDETFKDLESQQYVDQRTLMGKDFLIEGNLFDNPWKITGKKKQILDFMCMEATTTVNDSISVIAWFTPQIPISNGPALFGGLPGMILELDRDNGQMKIVATEIVLGELEEQIEIPSKGKRVSQEEFEVIREEKMKEMQAQGGRGGLRVIRRNG